MHVRVNLPKVILPLVIFGIVVAVIIVLLLSKPKAEMRSENVEPKIDVEVIAVKQSTITPKILSYGLVEPRTQTRLVSQVNGRIESISEKFRDGGFFREGETLLQIEATDYEIEVDIAKATLAEAEQVLAEEIARSEQARVDWERLGSQAAARPLVLREPYMKAAEARVNSAKALLRQAELNLSRTSIQAPYDGRVLSTSVALGRVVPNNMELGEIYATDAVEVRLPIKNNDLPLLDLPEDYLYQQRSAKSLPGVQIHSDLAQKEIWQGTIIRTAGSIDSNSRQLYVVARIDDPFGEKAVNRFPLKIGQYVTAEIDAINLESAISVPNKAIYQGSYVYLHREGSVYRTPIEISWQNGDVAIISSGISHGDQLVVSPLGQVVSGTLVNVSSGLTNKSDVGSEFVETEEIKGTVNSSKDNQTTNNMDGTES